MDDDKVLRATGAAFLAALFVHGADHLRRGVDVMTTQVFVGGSIQFALAEEITQRPFEVTPQTARDRVAALLAP